MTTSVNTSEYRAAHGKEPRGKGRWMFDLGRENGEWHEFAMNANYGTALAAAKAEAKRLGCYKIVVCS